MTPEQHITQAAARAAVAYRNGDDEAGAYWADRVTRLSDELEVARIRRGVLSLSGLTSDELDEVGGMPDHSGLAHA